MKPLTLDDLLPLEEYAARRGEFFAAHTRYLDRYRRARVGPLLTLIFENRQTLWFHLQEVLRVARLSEPLRVQQELDWYNQLLPANGRLQAAVLIDTANLDPGEAIKYWKDFRGDQLRLIVDQSELPARLLTDRLDDYVVGAAHWVEFSPTDAIRLSLGDFRRPARFVIEYRDYRHESAFLGEDVRQSLLDDLTLSERVAA